MKSTHESAFVALRPAALDHLGAEAHAARRETDLAAAFATPRAIPAKRRIAPRLLIAGAAAASVATAAAVVVVTGSGGEDHHVRRPTAAPRRLDARTVLLASAVSAAKAPATSGRYWYTDERTSSYVDQLLGRPQRTKTGRIRPPAVTKLPYGGFVSTGQESWIARDGSDRSRTITGIGSQTTFPTKADEAKWKAAGSPELLTPQKRSVNDYGIPLRFTIGGRQVTMAALRKLPTSAPRLEADLNRRFRADHAGADGFTLYVWETAADLLAGPITPGTKAALYRVLAGLPGIKNAGAAKDRLGRAGTALALPDSDGESRLIVDQRSGALLAHESWAMGARYPRLSEAYRSMGWAGRLGDRP
ncbi:hypothetical protein GCM10027176_73730 [Actinoallomurus bryophytorum]|uniref:CU044_5270 family protein n=1 Tax=Actinoallomurus bryophytorum TaxID=1490222 RepID=A0A543CBW7_9ACTN|nr:CU044_5270 family protein [Actinoallomurus bryophytorum]TQL94574.1 hypothetical protein FB559_0049 [Actinoallomurus bryophytorum]